MSKLQYYTLSGSEPDTEIETRYLIIGVVAHSIQAALTLASIDHPNATFVSVELGGAVDIMGAAT